MTFRAAFPVSVFRAITHQYQCSELSSSHFQFQRSEPSSTLLSIGVQSHCLPSFRRSGPCFASFGIQSHCPLLIRCSEPLHIVHFDVRSHTFILCSGPLYVYYYYYLVFCVKVLDRHSESSCLSFVWFITTFLLPGIQNHWAHSFGPLEPFLFFNFDVQSHYYIRHLPPLPHFSFSLAFKAVFHTHSCILSHHLS